MPCLHDLFRGTVSRYPQVEKRHLRMLLAHSMGTSIEFLMAHPEALVSDDICQQFLIQAKKLADGMPLSRLLGKREFWGMDFKLSKETLDPRPDSETLIETVLKHRLDREESLKILDLGTGSGCLIISLLKEYPNAQGLAVDQSKEALQTTLENARTHEMGDRLRGHQGDWFEGVSGVFDVIISNPPYITDDDYKTLADNVKKYDPQGALVAGEEGIDGYKKIIPAALFFLKDKGILVLEIGQGQRKKVQKLMEESGFHTIHVYHDLAGIERCLVGVN